MPSKAQPAPATLEAKPEALGQTLARLKAELITIERDATIMGFPMQPAVLVLGRLTKPTRRR